MHVQIIYVDMKVGIEDFKTKYKPAITEKDFQTNSEKMLEIHVLLRFSLFVKKINISLLCFPKLTKMEILQVCQHALHEQVHIH